VTVPGKSAVPAPPIPVRKYQPPRIRKRITMLSLLRDPEFAALTFTQFFSVAGDQMARVALSVLVFNRTNSALQAAITYALTFIPAAIGGPLLSGLADRRPRRSVMIASDLARAPLIGLIAIPSLPLPLALALLAIAGLFEAPFNAARGALLPDVLTAERYQLGYALSQIVTQTAQVGGFGLAGLLLIAWSPSVIVVIDAGTFVLSALVIARLVRQRVAPVGEGSHPDAWWTHAFSDLKTSVRIVLRDPPLRLLALLAWVTSIFAIGYEALAAPLSRASGSASWSVGVLLAAEPAGTVVGALLVARVPPRERGTVLRVLPLLGLAALIVGLTKPPLAILITIGFACGLCMSFHVLASTAFVERVAPEVRGRALGLVGTGLLVTQGVGVLLAGGLATVVDARVALGWLGVAGAACVAAVLIDGIRNDSGLPKATGQEPKSSEKGHVKATD
jgi:MFS family permease